MSEVSGEVLEIGKLSADQLRRLVLDKFISKRADVICGASLGVDCAVVDFGSGGELCVLSTDPITAAAHNIGEIAVHICCNDAAAAGAEPIGILTTLLLPVGCTEEEVDGITTDIANAAKSIGIDVLGGHTEVTDAVNRIVISATVVAKSGRERIDSAGMLEGDDIVLTKWAGLEGTAIIAHDFAGECKKVLSDEEYQNALELKRHLSVVTEGRLCKQFGVHALHDVTEGGVLGAVWEMASASGRGAQIDSEKIPIRAETTKLCGHFNIDPLKLISSGCMLIACEDGEALTQALAKANILASTIGKATQSGIHCDKIPITPPQKDELYKISI